MSKQDIEDRDWWSRVGKLIGSTLHGWSYRNSASFVNPQQEVNGRVATMLLEQAEEIERLRENAKRMQADLLRKARLYQADDGSPGPLSNQWGWRDMATTLREAAEAAEGGECD